MAKKNKHKGGSFLNTLMMITILIVGICIGIGFVYLMPSLICSSEIKDTASIPKKITPSVAPVMAPAPGASPGMAPGAGAGAGASPGMAPAATPAIVTGG